MPEVPELINPTARIGTQVTPIQSHVLIPLFFTSFNVGLMTISMHVFLGSLGPIPKSTCDSSNMRTDPSTNPLAPGRQGKFSELSNVKGGKWHLIVFSILYLFNDWHG